MSIPPEKLTNISQICREWQHKKFCSKRDLQSLLGSLLYVSKCVKHSRMFLSRMLNTLRDHHSRDMITLNDEFQKDIHWFNVFLHSFNGVTFSLSAQYRPLLNWMLLSLAWGHASMIMSMLLAPQALRGLGALSTVKC